MASATSRLASTPIIHERTFRSPDHHFLEHSRQPIFPTKDATAAPNVSRSCRRASPALSGQPALVRVSPVLRAPPVLRPETPSTAWPIPLLPQSLSCV